MGWCGRRTAYLTNGSGVAEARTAGSGAPKLGMVGSATSEFRVSGSGAPEFMVAGTVRGRVGDVEARRRPEISGDGRRGLSMALGSGVVPRSPMVLTPALSSSLARYDLDLAWWRQEGGGDPDLEWWRHGSDLGRWVKEAATFGGGRRRPAVGGRKRRETERRRRETEQQSRGIMPPREPSWDLSVFMKGRGVCDDGRR
uniref:Uncharacterized protein n=1 Tax=Oryza glumipatula TaxID=40148 RepID=A0A0D9ZDM5_9ORYZ